MTKEYSNYSTLKKKKKDYLTKYKKNLFNIYNQISIMINHNFSLNVKLKQSLIG